MPALAAPAVLPPLLFYTQSYIFLLKVRARTPFSFYSVVVAFEEGARSVSLQP